VANLLTVKQLTGQDESHLISLALGHQLQARAALAFEALQGDASEAGFALVIASSFRSFDRQRAIWNGKAAGTRPVHDDAGQPVVLAGLSPSAQIHAIMRFSALPGTSRHHWGSDLDVFDAGALPRDYKLQLSPAEVAPGGIFDPLHRWLDERMAADQSHGYFRPYAIDRGGVAPERWHLSYAPIAAGCGSACNRGLLEPALEAGDIALWEEVREELEALLQRYVTVPMDWCPANYFL
jgi:LAS superfamily LD-carboxypeptidase LdcB